MKAIQIEAFGNPAEVLKLVDIPDVGAPSEGEVVIALEASPINMSDLLMISGRYGYRPKLPSVMGTEGVGRVIAVGGGVKHLKQGDRTLVPYPTPAWAERVKANASQLRPLPGGDVHQLAMLGINPPTAYLMLTDFVSLPSGSWVIQNSANSGVGRALIPIAKSLGLKTVNVVPRDALYFPRHFDARVLAGQLVQGRKTPPDHRDVRSAHAAGRVGCDQRANCRHLQFR